MLFRRVVNDKNVIFYVAENHDEETVVIDSLGKRKCLPKDMLQKAGFVYQTPSNVGLLLDKFDNSTVVIPKEITEIELIGDVLINGHIDMEGDRLHIKGRNLRVINDNPRAPLIGKAARFLSDQVDEVISVTTDLNLFEWSTPNEFFMFGSYGHEPLDAVNVLSGTTTYILPKCISPGVYHDGKLFAYGIEYANNESIRLICSRYLKEDLHEYADALNAMYNSRFVLTFENVYGLLERGGIHLDITVDALKTILQLEDFRKDHKQLEEYLFNQLRMLDRENLIRYLKEFYYSDNPYGLLAEILESVQKLEISRYKVYLEILMYLYLPVVCIRDWNQEHLEEYYINKVREIV